MTGTSTAFEDVGLTAQATDLDGGSVVIIENSTNILSYTLANPSESGVTGGLLTFATVANATAAANASSGLNRIQLKTSGGTVRLDWKNLSYTITAANQNTSTDIFTITSHELETNQMVIPSGTLPTTSPQIVAGQTLWVIDDGTNTIQLALQPHGTAIDITSAAGDDTFTITRIPRAIVASGASQVEKDQAYVVSNESALTVTSGEVYSITSMTLGDWLA